jgi:WD40 repeat protein
MNNLFDAFISYGRADSKAFATKVHTRLLDEGLKVWFDQNDIPLGVDFQNQIDDGIEKAHNFLFIIAPHSVKSAYCLKEIQLAVKRNKRIIPLLHVEPNDCWDKMHPTIGKINWIYFREEQDDFEAAFSGLIRLIRSQADYVEQHTRFLAKALEWERHQKQNSCLLIGEERLEAQSWLKRRFKDEQPPCVPTDLHCEFISESMKNANNLMTQVFMSYSDKDKEVMKKISQTLMREGFTVWTNKTDIKTGTEFQEEVNKGIEGADNVVCLISPTALQSWYWQQEVAHAFANNKRIIPLLIEPTELDSIHPNLRALQFIDFTTHLDEAKYRNDADKLVKILYQDKRYYEEHKILLVKTLKWQEQNGNRSILLRGHNLHYYEHWLKVHQQRREHPPLPLQVEFISSSSNQPPESSLEVFISYSRADSDFARKLNEALQIQGKTTWFDQESIPPGSDFQEEIYRGIDSSDNFLFIISPRAVNSPYCADEVEYARKLNKRFVTVLHRDVSAKELHPALASVQWIDFNRHGGDFYPNLSELVRTLDTDREHVKSHTKWSQRALEWEEKGKSADLLLRGIEFEIAQNWLQEAEQQNKQPAPTDLQKEFIKKSRDAILAGKRWLHLRLFALTSAFIVSTVLAIVAGIKWREADLDQIRSLSTSSEALLLSNKQSEALIASLQAGKKLKQAFWPTAELHNQVRGTLQQVVYGVKERNRLEGHQDRVYSVMFSPDGRLVATASKDGTAKLWDMTGKQLALFQGHRGKVNSVMFSPDSKLVATASSDGTARLWDLRGKTLVTFNRHRGEVNSVMFSPNGQLIATASKDGTARLWDLKGKQLTEFRGHHSGVNSVMFSPNGQLVATASLDKTARLWDLKGKQLATFKGHQEEVRRVIFSPSGQFVATASRDRTARLWDLSGKQLALFYGHQGTVSSVIFSPNGKLVATASLDKTARLWNLKGKLLAEFPGHHSGVDSLMFSPNGQLLATASREGTVRLWDLSDKQLAVFQGHQGAVRSVMFSPNGKLLATASKDGTARLWDLKGKTLAVFKGHQGPVTSLMFSLNGEQLATASREGTARLWDLSGQQLAVFQGHQGEVNSAIFSPNGKLLATASKDGTARLWNLSGQQLAVLQGHQGEVMSVVFSPNGEQLATASKDSTARLWDLKGERLAVFKGHQYAVTSLIFSPNGEQLATASVDHTARLWDLKSKQLISFDGHQSPVTSLIFSPDGEQLATASSDGTARLWDLKGKQLVSFDGHQSEVTSVVFSPNGKQLATASSDGTARLWEISFDELLSRGCDWVRDYLKNSPNVAQSDRSVCDDIGEK